MMALLVLSATILPHHHHLSRICFAVERCAVDGQTNDEHTSHDSQHHSDDTDDCPAKGVKTVKVLSQNSDSILRMAQLMAATEVAVCAVPAANDAFSVRCGREAMCTTMKTKAHAESLRGPPTRWA